MDKRNLIFFTEDYPYSLRETFIENEVPYLINNFNKIIIVSTNITDLQERQLPENILLFRFPYSLTRFEKIKSIASFFSCLFWEEILIIKNKYKKPINLKKIVIIISSLYKAKKYSRFIQKIIKDQNIKTTNLYLYSYWLNDTAIATAYFKKKNKDIVAISRAHRWDIYFEQNSNNYLPLRKFLTNTLDKIYSISENGKEYLLNLLSNIELESERIDVARLGTRNHKNLNYEGIKNNELQLLSISTIYPVKRVELIIEALYLIKNIKINWIHFGMGKDYEKIEALCCDKLQPKANINCNLMGLKSNKEIISFLKNSHIDLFINVSTSEGIPVSIMEAMSFGIPCMATNVGGTNEIVNNKNGILLSANPSPKDIAEKITSYFNSSNDYKIDKSKASYEMWNENYNAEKNYLKFITDFQSLNNNF